MELVECLCKTISFDEAMKFLGYWEDGNCQRWTVLNVVNQYLGKEMQNSKVLEAVWGRNVNGEFCLKNWPLKMWILPWLKITQSDKKSVKLYVTTLAWTLCLWIRASQYKSYRNNQRDPTV
jgi:hypothetical protein